MKGMMVSCTLTYALSPSVPRLSSLVRCLPDSLVVGEAPGDLLRLSRFLESTRGNPKESYKVVKMKAGD